MASIAKTSIVIFLLLSTNQFYVLNNKELLSLLKLFMFVFLCSILKPILDLALWQLCTKYKKSFFQINNMIHDIFVIFEHYSYHDVHLFFIFPNSSLGIRLNSPFISLCSLRLQVPSVVSNVLRHMYLVCLTLWSWLQSETILC